MASDSDMLLNIRKRVLDAVEAGLLQQEDHGVYQLTLLSIINECKSQQIKCQNLATEYKKNAAQAEAQASSYAQMQALVYRVVNGLVQKTEQDNALRLEEDKARSEEEVEKLAYAQKVDSAKVSSTNDTPKEVDKPIKEAVVRAAKKKTSRKTTRRRK